MLAARDQENRLFGHSVAGASGKHHTLGPKTPGAKVPLNNGTGGKSVLGGRPGNENLHTVGKGKGKSNLVTPLEPRTARAPLGNKTTNAKALAAQQNHNLQQQKSRGGVKDIVREFEKSTQQQQQQAPSSGRRARVISPRTNSNPYKLSVLSDDKTFNKSASGEEEDIEYAPPRVPAQPYESDVFPDGVLTFAAFKPQNRLRGYYDYYYNPVDEEDGVPLRDKEFAERQRRAFEKLDIQVQDDLDAFDWTVGDVPATKDFFANKRKQNQQTLNTKSVPSAMKPESQAPPTIVSRNAASALALASSKPRKPTVTSTATALRTKPAPRPMPNASSAASSSAALLSGLPLRKPRPASSAMSGHSTSSTSMPLRPKSTNHPVAESASRTTLGYNKGRTALSMVRGTAPPPTDLRSVASRSGMSTTRRAGPSTDANEGPASSSAMATPNARRLQKQASLADIDMHSNAQDSGAAEPRSPAFLSIFEVDDEQDSLGGASTFVNDDLDDDFQMDIKF